MIHLSLESDRPLNDGFDYSEKVGPHGDGRTVVDYLSECYPHSTRQEWEERIEAGRVIVDERIATRSTHLRRGQTLTWKRPPWREPDAPRSFAVLYRDEALLAVAKPSGLATMPGGGFLENTLLRLVRRAYPQTSPLHRLGRGTSGIVLFGRTPDACRVLTNAWQAGEVHRQYVGLVDGRFEPPETIIEEPIGPVPHALLGTIEAVSPEGRPARTRVRRLELREDTSLVEVLIDSGRTHQIRIHLAAAGHPLLGDPLYPPGGVPTPDCRVLPGELGYNLHAERLTFAHPQTGRRTELFCMSPPLLRRSPSKR